LPPFTKKKKIEFNPIEYARLTALSLPVYPVAPQYRATRFVKGVELKLEKIDFVLALY